MNRDDTNGTSPDFHSLLDRSDEVFASIRQLMSDPQNRDIDTLRALNDEAARIADEMERAVLLKNRLKMSGRKTTARDLDIDTSDASDSLSYS